MASKVLTDLGLQIPHIGLAKRLEEVYFPDHPEPLRIPRGSESLFVLQHLRDEAHRFAITYHRQKREKRALASPLDDIPGVGPARKKALLQALRFVDPAACRRGRGDRRHPGHRPRTGAGGPRGAAHDVGANGLDGRAGRRRGRQQGECLTWPRPTSCRCHRATSRSARHRLHPDHRPVRGRAVRGRAFPRRPRVLRGRQPAAGAARQDGRAGLPTGRSHPGRHRGRRPRRACSSANSRRRSTS